MTAGKEILLFTGSSQALLVAAYALSHPDNATGGLPADCPLQSNLKF